MSDIDWFEDDFNLTENFSKEVLPLIYSIEGQKEAIHKLKESKENLSSNDQGETYEQIQGSIIAHTIEALEADNKEKLDQLYKIKKSYLEEDFVGSLETLTSAEGGLAVSDAACELMQHLTNLLREAGLEEY